MEASIGSSAVFATALLPVSADRTNQQKPLLVDLTDSPNLSNLPPKLESEVLGKVAQYNSLNKDGLERKSRHEAALKRAILGREEAENESRRWKEELLAARNELDAGKDRERKVGERLDALMEELHNAKEQRSLSHTRNEKERRRLKKESLKSASAMIRAQEELKSTRSALSQNQITLEEQRNKIQEREEEAFAARYQLIGLQEQLAQLQEQKKAVENERDMLKSNRLQEEVAQMQEHTLPVKKEKKGTWQDRFRDEFCKIALATQGLDKDSDSYDPIGLLKKALFTEQSPELEQQRELQFLKDNIRWLQASWKEAEETIEFMKMECQFLCCPCRAAERKGEKYIFDDLASGGIKDMIDSTWSRDGKVYKYPFQAEIKKTIDLIDISTNDEPLPQAPPQEGLRLGQENKPTISPIQTEPLLPSHSTTLSQTTIPFLSSGLPPLNFSSSVPRPSSPTLILSPPLGPLPSPHQRPHSSQDSVSHSPHSDTQHRTITTTTRVPLAGPASFSPATMTREEAIEQIRLRRGRARSFAQGTLTPRRPGVESVVRIAGEASRRDISAPAARSVSRPASRARRDLV
ncbi:MAG: hypothetical protein M1829_005742 [Trizodia sp. TS-e1964]|nr:MAG: hypothetical protein M1829_005742 [Trizodia sp. TS-e1964]